MSIKSNAFLKSLCLRRWEKRDKYNYFQQDMYTNGFNDLVILHRYTIMNVYGKIITLRISFVCFSMQNCQFDVMLQFVGNDILLVRNSIIQFYSDKDNDLLGRLLACNVKYKYNCSNC
jgi:hypothetical protein